MTRTAWLSLFLLALTACEPAPDASSAQLWVEMERTRGEGAVGNHPDDPAPASYVIELDIAEILAHRSGDRGDEESDDPSVSGWISIGSDLGWYATSSTDLGEAALIARKTVPAGPYDAVRIVVDDARVVIDGEVIPVDVPSGDTSGLYIGHGFCLDPGQFERLAFAIDMASNLHEVNGRWWLTPAFTTTDAPECDGMGTVIEPAAPDDDS